MFRRNTCFIHSAFILLLSPLAQAQENMTLQFLAFPQKPEAEFVELLVGDKKTIKVATPGNELSQSYKVPALSSISVGAMEKNDKGETVFKSYGSARSLACPKQIVLLIRKGDAQSDGFAVLPIDAGEANFKAASYMFINASALAVAATVGDQKLALKPGKTQMIKPSPDHANGMCQVTFFYQKEDEEWKKIYDTRWPSNDKFRSIVFFYQDPKTGGLSIAPIVDVMPYKPGP